MGQKVHPEGMRLGIIKTWKSKWLAKKNFKDLLYEDLQIRNYIKKKLYRAGISKIEIENAINIIEKTAIYGLQLHQIIQIL
jgi:small subunit ribosomal protein S3